MIEVLLAMAMVAVLAGSLYVSLHIGFRARERSEAALAPVRAVGVVFDLLNRDIQNAPAPRGVLAGAFVGKEDSLNLFTRAMSTTDAAPGIVGAEYSLTEDEKKDKVLVRHVTVNLLSPEEQTPPDEVLCRNVSSFGLRYYDGANWLDSWDSTTQGDSLPMAVEAVIEISGYPNGNDNRDTRNFRLVIIPPCSTIPAEATVTALTPS